MSKILNYIWRGWFAFLAFFFLLLLGPSVLLFSFKPKHFPIAYRFIRWWCLAVFYGMGFRYKILNPDHHRLNPEENYILVANHTSTIDIMMMCILHPQHPICFIGKAELGRIPIFGMVYRRVCILVDRTNPKSRARVYELAAAKIRHGQNLVIFPEGGVPDDETVVLDEFKDGAFKMAAEHGIPIEVQTIIGLKKMFPFAMDRGYPGRVRVVKNGILPPGNAHEMKTAARALILKTLQEYEQQ